MARQKMGGKRKKSVSGRSKKSRPRRRMSGGGKIETVAMNGIAVAAGLIGMNELAVLGGAIAPSLMGTPMVVGLIEAALGGLIAWKAKSGFLTYAGLGGFANGIYTIGKGAGVIGAGPQVMSYQYANRRMMGDPRLQFVAGPTSRIGTGMGSYPNNFAAVAGAGVGARRKVRYSS